MLCLSGYELYSRWVPLKLVHKKFKPEKKLNYNKYTNFIHWNHGMKQ